MKRDLSPEELRQEAVDELTAKHYEILRRKLQGGDPKLAADIDEAVFANLPSAFWRDSVVAAANCFDLTNGARIRKLVEQALMALAEVHATKEVEQRERQNKQLRDEARAERALNG